MGGNGLSLVEPGPATDPVAAGLKAAIARARRAWEASQPQLTITGWADMLDELDTREAARAGRVPSAAASLVSSPPSPVGLTADPLGGLDSTSTGSAADPALETRGAAQKGA